MTDDVAYEMRTSNLIGLVQLLDEKSTQPELRNRLIKIIIERSLGGINDSKNSTGNRTMEARPTGEQASEEAHEDA